MRFIDEAKIKVSGGHGGKGCVSFRREKYIPRGGPDGGDGGDGGDVVFIATHQMSTLQDFRFKRVYAAPPGKGGSGANKAGRDGENIEIKIPVGTVAKDAKTGEELVDFTNDQQKWIACKGGRGGKGNAHFVSSTFQAPKFAQPGEEGDAKELILELKLLADVAIIGFPNVGKSTFISRVSAAKPKIADYPFTTLTPNLGVVSLPGREESFVLADIPGLIEGAHKGAGLGDRFLKHIERTRVLVHLLDGARLLEEEFETAIKMMRKEYRIIRKELGLFSKALLDKPEIVVINKVDLLENETALLKKLKTEIRREIRSTSKRAVKKNEPFLISAVAGKHINELLGAIHAEVVKKTNTESQ